MPKQRSFDRDVAVIPEPVYSHLALQSSGRPIIYVKYLLIDNWTRNYSLNEPVKYKLNVCFEQFEKNKRRLQQ